MYQHLEISTVSILLARFSGCARIPFVEALASLGYHIPTARNQRTLGTFPIPVVKRGSRLFIELSELIKFAVEEASPAASVVKVSTVHTKKTRRGRPLKADQISARQNSTNGGGAK